MLSNNNGHTEDYSDRVMPYEHLENAPLIPEPQIPMVPIVGDIEEPEIVEPSVPDLDYAIRPSASTPLYRERAHVMNINPLPYVSQSVPPQQVNPTTRNMNPTTPLSPTSPQGTYVNISPQPRYGGTNNNTVPQQKGRPNYMPYDGTTSPSSRQQIQQPALYGKQSATDGCSSFVPFAFLVLGIILFILIDFIVLPILFLSNFIIPILPLFLCIFVAIIPAIPHMIGSLFIAHPNCWGRSLGYSNLFCALFHILVVLCSGIFAVGSVVIIVLLLIGIVICTVCAPILLPILIIAIVFCAVSKSIPNDSS